MSLASSFTNLFFQFCGCPFFTSVNSIPCIHVQRLK
ncbi:MAG: SWIM zinc finger family protein [Bacteroidaceae bacterium]|nr:SWIM zinc finger family protein [Bacteroidaceae bacterium]